MKKTNCIILAGGQATRMGDASKGAPKTLLEVGGESILANQIKKIQRSITRNIIISTNTEINKGLIERNLKKNNLDNIEIIVNKLHEKGSLWGLLGAIEHLGEKKIIFCFSDIYFFDLDQRKPVRETTPWLSGYWSTSKKEISRGGVISSNSETGNATKLYYKKVPKNLEKAMIWSGLTKLTEKETSLIRFFLEANKDDTSEEDFINFCIDNGSKFTNLDTGLFTNINSYGDLIKVRRTHDKNNL